MDIYFSNIEELKQRLMPALRLRKKELRKQNYQISEEELWNYFVNHFWRQSVQLSLSQMVEDILNKEVKQTTEDII